MRRLTALLVLALTACAAGSALAKVDLVTLPERESVQLTIYNSADLTLVRDRRPLTLRKGENRLQFSWANTLIDPTSLEMQPKGQAGEIDVFHISYPPRVKDVGIWEIRSEVSGRVPMEITCFTSGLTWQSFYLATLAPDQQSMELEGYVRVTNNSGEDYENAQTRLVVGKINLLDRIAELARRAEPYGRPIVPRPEREEGLARKYDKARRMLEMAAPAAGAAAPKEIKKEGVSEYFLYTIEGTETIKDGWSKRLPSFQAASVGVENLYKFEKERYGDRVVRFLRFRNDREHNLGETPLPGGLIKVFGRVDEAGHLRYLGADNSQYIPVDQKVELNLGAARKVHVEQKVMDFRKEHIVFDDDGDVSGFDEVKDHKIEVRNHSGLPVKVEITRNLPSAHWELKNAENPGDYRKVDQDTVRYTLRLGPHSEKDILYTLRVFHGDRRYSH